MKVIAIIPARYGSSRFPGKPLSDICGKPMIWWVYNQVRKAKKITDVIVATDDTRIEAACKQYDINCIMTSSRHKTSTERLNEVAQSVPSDLYIAVNGDEPLIDPDLIDAIVPSAMPDSDFFVSNLMSPIDNPVEALDSSNIKIVTDEDDYALLYSRSMIPYPKSSLEYQFYKHVGVILYTKSALEFFANTPKGKFEKIEDINELRFLEHGKRIKMVRVNAHSLSVDTPMDLERIRTIIKNRGNE